MHLTYHDEEPTSSPDRPVLEIEITTEMIEAGWIVMATFDPEYASWGDGVREVLEAALTAGGHLREHDGEFTLLGFLRERDK